MANFSENIIFFRTRVLSRNFFEDLNRETKWSKSVNWTENYAKINTCETQFPSPLEITFKKKINQLKLAKYEKEPPAIKQKESIETTQKFNPNDIDSCLSI